MNQRELFIKNGAPEKFIRVIEDGPDRERIHPLVKKYLTDFKANKNTGKSLVSFSRASGLGKSFDICWLLWEAQYENFQWTTPAEIVKTYIRDYEQFDYWFKKCGILVIDNFGHLFQKSEYNEQFYTEVFQELFLARDDDCRPIFITTNFTDEELIAKHGDYVVRRLWENAEGFVFEKTKVA